MLSGAIALTIIQLRRAGAPDELPVAERLRAGAPAAALIGTTPGSCVTGGRGCRERKRFPSSFRKTTSSSVIRSPYSGWSGTLPPA